MVEPAALRLTTDGCELPGDARFRWSEVERISALTRSTGEEELLTMRFLLRNGQIVEINEGVPGFTQLVGFLPEVLSGFPDQNEWIYGMEEAGPTEEQILFEAPDTPPAAGR